MALQTEQSANTKALMDALRIITIGGEASYSHLSEQIGRNVQAEARGALGSARRALLREGIRFDVVRDVGLRRMTDSEVARSGARGMRLVHSAARREAKKLTAVEKFDALPNEDKVAHNAAMSVLGAVAHFTAPKQVQLIEAATGQTQRRLPIADSLDTLRRTLGKDGGRKAE